jgi:hypothetical protein
MEDNFSENSSFTWNNWYDVLPVSTKVLKNAKNRNQFVLIIYTRQRQVRINVVGEC